MPEIDDYAFGRIVVDGAEERRDLIVLPTRVVRNWWRQEGHALVEQDLEAVADELPERLIVGTGAHGRMRPDPRLVEALRARGIALEAVPTTAAVRRYREADPARTAAALHLTC